MNVIVKAKFKTFEDVKQFVVNNGNMIGEVFARSSSFLVNGKSMLGMLSLDLTNKIDVEFVGEEEEITKALARNERFLIKEERLLGESK